MKYRLAFVFAAGAMLGNSVVLPKELQSLAGLAHAAPPEIAADTLLRIAESGKVGDNTAREDLINEAYQLSTSAHFPVRKRAIRGISPDSHAGMLNQAYALKLDTVSLQSRAVVDMLAVNKKKARELFTGIVLPQLALLTCQDALTYDVSDYYTALASVAQNSFTELERKKEDHLSFVLSYSTAATPSQLPALLAMVKRIALTDAQREAVVTRIGGALENMSADDRSFQATVDDLRTQMVPQLQPTFDKYVARQTKSSVCVDPAKNQVDLAPNAGSDASKGQPAAGPYWQSSPAQSIMTAVRDLRFGGAVGAPLAENGAAPTRDQQVINVLQQIEMWTASTEDSEADYFHEKATVYQALFEALPGNSEQANVLQAFVAFVRASGLQTQSPAEWLMHARSILDRARDSGNAQAAALVAGFQNSGDTVLSLYATLDRAFQGALPEWVVAGPR